MNQKIYHLAFEDDTLQDHIIAIHSSIEAYQIAFFLNQRPAANFKRVDDIAFQDTPASFLMYEWENPLLDVTTTLFSNKAIHEQSPSKINNSTLFELPLRNEVPLFPKFKQVDFFIKSQDLHTIDMLLKPLNTWKSTSMVYKMPEEKIKNRLNLIFD